MLQNIDLRELAELRGNGRDFVSAYFPGDQGLDSLKHREDAIHAMLEDNSLELEIFEDNMRRIREILAGESVADAECVCIFACGLLDFVRGYPISMSVSPILWVGPSPYLRPLAELQEEYETFAVVVCDNTKTRIFIVTNEQAEVEDTIRGGIKNHVRKGGWSQQRYERRRDNELQQYAKDISESLEELRQVHGFERIVLIGSQETIQEIEQELPDRLVELVVASKAFDLHRGDDAVVEAGYAEYFVEEREEEEDLWGKIKNRYLSHDRAVVGATDVLEAALQGRIDTMIVVRDAKIPGTQCRDCEHVVHGTPDTCQQCGSSSIFHVDLIDTLVRQMELTSAEIEFADPLPGLTKNGNVAALLRY